MNCELPDVQAGFRKDRGIRGQIANICLIMEKAREFHKNIYCEPDILECKVRSILGRITVNKAVGGDGIPAKLFQILKNDPAFPPPLPDFRIRESPPFRRQAAGAAEKRS